MSLPRKGLRRRNPSRGTFPAVFPQRSGSVPPALRQRSLALRERLPQRSGSVYPNAPAAFTPALRERFLSAPAAAFTPTRLAQRFGSVYPKLRERLLQRSGSAAGMHRSCISRSMVDPVSPRYPEHHG
jgi:hypothetical protein